MNDFERDVKCFVVRAQCFPTYRFAICSPRPLLASNLACNAFAATSNRILGCLVGKREEKAPPARPDRRRKGTALLRRVTSGNTNCL